MDSGYYFHFGQKQYLEPISAFKLGYFLEKGVDGTGKWMTSKENIHGLKQLHLDAESGKATSPIQSIELAQADREEMTKVNAVGHAFGPDTLYLTVAVQEASMIPEFPNCTSLSAGMLASADEVSQTSALDKDRRDESISPDQYSRPRKSKSARIDDRIQHPWLRLMWVLVMMSL